jgi:uncharacterized membrane protein
MKNLLLFRLFRALGLLRSTIIVFCFMYIIIVVLFLVIGFIIRTDLILDTLKFMLMVTPLSIALSFLAGPLLKKPRDWLWKRNHN